MTLPKCFAVGGNLRSSASSTIGRIFFLLLFKRHHRTPCHISDMWCWLPDTESLNKRQNHSGKCLCKSECSTQQFQIIWDVLFSNKIVLGDFFPMLSSCMSTHWISQFLADLEKAIQTTAKCGNHVACLLSFHTVNIFHPLSLVCVCMTTVRLSTNWPSSSVFGFCVFVWVSVCALAFCGVEGGGGVSVSQQGFLQCKWT